MDNYKSNRIKIEEDDQRSKKWKVSYNKKRRRKKQRKKQIIKQRVQVAKVLKLPLHQVERTMKKVQFVPMKMDKEAIICCAAAGAYLCMFFIRIFCNINLS